jgi:AraC-like DNA-binding protein
MTARTTARPRQRQPELEHDYSRSPLLGYELPAETGFVRTLAHGYPTPLARWHFHDEYELHLITATVGKAFVGDWIGPFEPGHLVLVGPRLPHNWISADMPEAGVAERDLVIQFAHGPVAHAAEQIPELQEVMALLERARHGIEFFGLGERAVQHFHAVRSTRGMQRLAAFMHYLSDLARSTDFRLLSSVQMQGPEGGDDDDSDQVNALVNRIARDFAQPLSASEIAAELGMTESRFSRFFRRATGNTFTDFVNRIRVNRACQLLMDTDGLVTHIGYEVGFNNLANFNRRFLEIKGVTPSEFRRQSDRRFGSPRGVTGGSAKPDPRRPPGSS